MGHGEGEMQDPLHVPFTHSPVPPTSVPHELPQPTPGLVLLRLSTSNPQHSSAGSQCARRTNTAHLILQRGGIPGAIDQDTTKDIGAA
ncbi:hypothetical protein K443DRAFT_679448 [Laccaria amethystina LaAM-08-1]|uniref:Uncharacterized protein n=1 Tax=Laccaria amethystina LaAM-08-1 TaxID=1095629 RepID=A0A0C9XES3_9AGAR|nr:hypothetical protein K443DRAFT_679448 [Laccaria amethystina LaAM-08-1]